MYDNMSILDWCQAMISLHDQPKLTLEKFKQVRKDYDNGTITEEQFKEIIDEMNLAGGYDSLGD